MSRTRIAFFDVDGTLTNATSLFRFLRHYLAAQGHGEDTYLQRRRHIMELAARGVPREETNRAYFANFAGAEADRVAALGERWLAAELDQQGFFNAHVVGALHRHREAGDRVVLVSGSFPACLDPIAAHLGADAVRCSNPRISEGRYTGELVGPAMIGAAKAEAVRQACAFYGIPAERCVSYGDHLSDLPMLEETGDGVLIGEDPALDAVRRAHWSHLPAQPAPPPLDLFPAVAATGRKAS
ncbi:HAD-IB family hydrolase [Streptomyces hundungensis]|uniref:HAD family hydrolase n=1 Tax=Streptomyces hundungensis TaxID=1077946 RepID=UPI0033ECBB30